MVGRLFDLIGPIATKELIEIARRGRTYWLRAGYGLALLGCLWLAWNQYGGGYGIRALARLGEAIFRQVAVWQVLAVYLIVPSLVAPTIIEERVHGSLDLLLTTSLSDREIIFGKLASRLGVLFLLVLAALPVLSLVLLFGGVRAVDVWRLSGITLLEMILMGSLGIYFSASRATLGRAIRHTLLVAPIVGLCAFIVGLPIVAIVMIPVALVDMLDMAPFVSEASVWLEEIVPVCCYVPIVIVTADWFCTSATRNLRREPNDGVSARESTLAEIVRATRPSAWFGEEPRPGEDLRAQGIPWAKIVESRATAVIAPRSGFGWFVLVLVGVFVLTVSALLLGETSRPLAGLTLVACVIVLADACWLAAFNPIFARGRFRDALLTAPLDARELLAGAARVAWRQVRPVLAVVSPIVIAVIVGCDPVALLGLATAALFVVGTFLVGLACAIPHGNAKQPLAGMLVFLGVAGIGPLTLASGFDLPRLSWTWFVSLSLLVVARFRRGESPSGWKVGAELTLAYFFVVTTFLAPLAYMISLRSTPNIIPYRAISPIHWLPMARGAEHVIGSISGWLGAQALFCMAQALFVVWTWHWTIRNFEFLAGRPTRR